MKIEMTLPDGTRWTYERVDGELWNIRTTAGDGIDGPITPCGRPFGDQDVLLAVADGILEARRGR